MKLSATNGHSEIDVDGVQAYRQTETMDTDNVAATDSSLGKREPVPTVVDSGQPTDTDGEHSQASTPTAALVEKQRSGVTIRKRDLINLQSSLSPKYIGYANGNSPILFSDTDDSQRSTRRRTLNNSSTNRETKENEVAVATPKPLVEAQLLERSANKNYLSPIDKLLIKNGANSPNSTGFEADAEDVAIAPARKTIKRKLKRNPKAKIASVAATDTPIAVKEDEKKDELVVDLKAEMEKEKDSPKNNVEENIQIKQEPEAISLPDVDHQEETKTNESLEKQKDSDASNCQEVPLTSSRSSPDQPSVTLEATNGFLKSPSSVSIDSAKGLSIIIDPAWPTYQVGDLYWGKVFSFCFWPCMVCPDPLGQLVSKAPALPQRPTTENASLRIQVHVRFFADNGRRNWIKPENLLPFAGLKAFEELREEVRIKQGAKSGKYRQMVPKRNKMAVWQQAIEEAQMIAELPYAERLEKFCQMYENAIALNRQKRSSSMLQDTSDMGSSLYDSTDNLHARAPPLQPLIALKRERSESPLSPAFSPVKHLNEKRSKRRKLSSEAETETGPASSAVSSTNKTITTTSSGIYGNSEFGQLYNAIKEYVMGYQQDEKVEKVLLSVVNNIWSLKQIQLRELERVVANDEIRQQQHQQQLGSTLPNNARSGSGDNSSATTKRLSSRLKSMMLQRSITPVVVPDTVEPVAETRASETPKPRKPVNRPIEEVVEDILHLDRKYLFRGLNKEPVCKYCHEPGSELQRCSRGCNTWLHASCLERELNGVANATYKTGRGRKPTVTATPLEPITSSTPNSEAETGHVESEREPVELVCQECITGQSDACCICHKLQPPSISPPASPLKETGEQSQSQSLVVCSQPMCSTKFHISCCKYWPQANASKSSARCPMHVCHTCVSDDPSNRYQQLGSSKLCKCVKCPATYHQDSHCIPAGSRLLTSTHLICPRHNIAKADAHVNVLWCYICVKGGELVCCETCPIAVHAHCRNIPIKTNESYICEECESGRLPLYGEIVWAKFNNFRWWPSIILPPTEIPSNIQKKSHGPNDFVVRFFGTHDHGWISRRRVYLYIEGDTAESYKSKSQLVKNYATGVEEASRFLKIIKARRQEQNIGRLSSNKLMPPPYVKIKANKPVTPVRLVSNLEDLSVCDCQPGLEHPCGPESGCLNRMLFNECNPEYCRAGDRCENQMFEMRKSPRLDVVYMNDRGFGLVCREAIAEGDFVIEYVGEVINHAEFQKRMLQKQRDRDENYYFLGVEKDFIIDAGPKGNLARFMNHSCEPNCETQKWSVNCIHRVGLFAIKDIPANTELTFNYLWDDLMNNGKKACYCGAERCSGQIGGKLKDQGLKETTSAQLNGKSKGNGKVKPIQHRKSISSALRIHIVDSGASKKSKKIKTLTATASPSNVTSKIKQISSVDSPVEQ
ncbi:probable histone-lysine N-methyltransferase Mes-4 [Drosophila willistoni]|nr:probable histone-lysine N-methyltransferase Mes-4 [Drosophila willistoni]